MKRTQASESPSTDNLSPAQRSHAMRQVKGKNTMPELVVRAALRKLGHSGYRLHRKDVQGNPDIVWIGKRRAIFINGCFWHGHDCARGRRQPKTRAEYWSSKIARTMTRDQRNREELEKQGWTVLTIWECSIRDADWLEAALRDWFAGRSTTPSSR